MTEAERKALEWIDKACTWSESTDSANRNRATLKAMLARPVLPEELSDEMLDVLLNTAMRFSDQRAEYRRAYRALYAHLTKPKTPSRYEQERKAVHWFIDRMQEYGLGDGENATVARNMLEDRLKATALSDLLRDAE